MNSNRQVEILLKVKVAFKGSQVSKAFMINLKEQRVEEVSKEALEIYLRSSRSSLGREVHKEQPEAVLDRKHRARRAKTLW